MKVLSLFNGMSCGMMALNELGIEPEVYYSSEIDKYANKLSQFLYPGIIQLGDINNWKEWDIDLGNIDLILAGFPCQSWSMAGHSKGLDDVRGQLALTLVDVWKATAKENPNVKFLFENVKMKKEHLETVNGIFGVEPICINSALVSAQNRVRYYWTNLAVSQPEDLEIKLSSIIEHKDEHKYISDKALAGHLSRIEKHRKKGNGFGARIMDETSTKTPTITARYYKDGAECLIGGRVVGRRLNEQGAREDYNKSISIKQIFEPRKDCKTNCITTVSKDSCVYNKDKQKVRMLTPREAARLQTIPEDIIDKIMTSGVSNTQIYKMCGNGWTVKVIEHLLQNLAKIH